MKLIIDLPKNVIEHIDTIISSGKYNNYSQFMLIAVKNQITIENNQEEVFQSDQDVDTELYIQSDDMRQSPSSEKNENYLDIYTVYDEVKTVEEPNDKNIPTDCLWGQYNRFFPVKITLRTLTALLKDSRDKVSLDELQEAAYKEAQIIAFRLKRQDKKQKKDYGERLSSGLPVKSASKTENRFKNHFVGYLSKSGKLEGAPNALKFTNMFEDSDGIIRVGITKKGLAFASIRNMIIDEDNYEATLNEQESDFLIKHIFDNLDREKQAIILIMKKISSGVSTPNGLNEALKEISRDWSNVMINTIRAGLISRLIELGLLSRKKEGTKVQYVITDKGRRLISNINSQGELL